MKSKCYAVICILYFLTANSFINAQEEKIIWSSNVTENVDFFDETNWEYENGTMVSGGKLKPGSTIDYNIEINESTLKNVSENILMNAKSISINDSELLMRIPSGKGIDFGGDKFLINNSKVFTTYLANSSKVELTGKSSLFLYATDILLQNTTIDIKSQDSWVYLVNKKVAEVRTQIMPNVLINGQRADWGNNSQNQNCVVVLFNQGAVIIPKVNTPLRLYNNSDFTGSSIGISAKWTRNFGGLSKEVSSFTLKKGYMAVFLTDNDGAKTSKTYIAVDDDMNVTLEGEYDNKFTSVRLVRWMYASKKGAPYVNRPDMVRVLDATWYYEWEIRGWSSTDLEFVHMIRGNRPYEWNLSASQWNDVYWQGSPHFFYTNEPDSPVQGNRSVEFLVENYPDYVELGLRIGSPSYTDNAEGTKELDEFVTQIQDKKQRLDIIGVHYYQRGTAAQLKTRLTNFYNKYKLPIWVTEINHGCTWTGANKTELESRLGVANFLAELDKLDFVERYAFFSCGSSGPYSFWNGNQRGEATATSAHLNSVGRIYKFHIAPSSKGFTPPYYNILVKASIEKSLSTESLSERNNSRIVVYPNPASNLINFSELTGQDLEVKVFDTSGRLLITKTLKNKDKSIDINDLSVGLYVVSVKRGSYVTTSLIQKK